MAVAGMCIFDCLWNDCPADSLLRLFENHSGGLQLSINGINQILLGLTH